MSHPPAAAITAEEPAELVSARRWAIGAMIAGGLSGLLFPVLGCLLLVTMGIAMFLFPVLIPGFLVGTLSALRARSLELRVGPLTSRTKGALVLNGAGLALSLFLSAIAGGVFAISYFGR